MPLSKVSKLSRGAHLTHVESKNLALELGSMVDTSQPDEEGRIQLNSLINHVELRIGARCKINHFVEYNKALFEKFCIYTRKEKQQIYVTRSGRHNSGTWWVFNFPKPGELDIGQILTRFHWLTPNSPDSDLHNS